MKQHYQKSAHGIADKINSRITRFGSAAFRSDGVKKIKLDATNLEGDNKAFVEALNKEFDKLPEIVDKEEIERNITTAVEKVNTDLKAIIKAQGEEITALKESGNGAKKDMSLRGQIKSWLEREDVKKAVAAVKDGTTGVNIPSFELDMVAMKVPHTMTVGVNAGAYIPTPEIAPGVIDLVRIQPTFWDYLPKGRTNRAAYVWVNKVNKEGNAQFIGEGVLKPLASFDLETEISNAKKIAERMKASTEILEDIDGFATLIENELRYEVMMAANTALLTGVESSTVPAGITTFASAYTLTGVTTTNPNNFDAVRAAVAQLRSLHFNGALVAFMNSVDIATMELTKADDSGVYMLPPFANQEGTRISGVTIVEDNNIAPGYLLVADLTKLKTLIYKDFSISWGWENDDFSKNLVTVIGEMRLHSFHSSNHAGAFLYDSFSNIKTAITAA